MEGQKELDAMRKRIATITWDLNQLRVGDRKTQLIRELDELKKEYSRLKKSLEESDRNPQESGKKEDE